LRLVIQTLLFSLWFVSMHAYASGTSGMNGAFEVILILFTVIPAILGVFSLSVALFIQKKFGDLLTLVKFNAAALLAIGISLFLVSALLTYKGAQGDRNTFYWIGCKRISIV